MSKTQVNVALQAQKEMLNAIAALHNKNEENKRYMGTFIRTTEALTRSGRIQLTIVDVDGVMDQKIYPHVFVLPEVFEEVKKNDMKSSFYIQEKVALDQKGKELIYQDEKLHMIKLDNLTQRAIDSAVNLRGITQNDLTDAAINADKLLQSSPRLAEALEFAEKRYAFKTNIASRARSRRPGEASVRQYIENKESQE